MNNLMMRRLFPPILAIILIIGLVHIAALRNLWIENELAIALHTIAFILISLFLIQNISHKLNTIEHKKSEAEDTISKIETSLDTTPDAIVILDEQEIIKLVNAKTEKTFGYKRSELIGKKIETILEPIYPIDIYNGIPDRFFNSPVNASFELLAIKKMGTNFR